MEQVRGRRGRARRVLVALLVGALLLGVGASVPAGAAPPPVRLTAVGDFSSTAATRAVLGAMAAVPADAHLALGDLSYGVTGAEQAWCDLVTGALGAGAPFELLSGNHESNGQNGNINDFSACLPNQLPGLVGTYGRQYYVDVPRADPQVRYIAVSPGLPYPGGTWSYAAGTPRYDWTAAAIDGARAAGIPWVVVGMHKPCLSLGEYACDPGADFVSMLVDRRVDLVLTGHEHLYQRTHQLATSAACPVLVPGTFSPACVADTDGDLAQRAGTVFATVGTGGVPLRAAVPGDPEAGYFATSTATYGFLDLQLTATDLTASFVPVAGGTAADAFTVHRGPVVPDVPPSAVLAPPACTGLTCTFDASASTDPDGRVVAQAWSFGDGTTGRGPTPVHAYATGGTYAVTVTVTDDQGVTASASTSVTVTGPAAPPPFATDTWTRTVTGGWGRADLGGAWSTGTALSSDGSSGLLRMATAGSSVTATLGTTSSTSTDLQLAVSSDRAATGGGTYVSLVGRRVGTAGAYRLTLRHQPGGAVTASLARVVSGVETQLAAAPVPGLLAPGAVLQARVQVTGLSPTTLRGKVWPAGTAEPAGWTLVATDSTAALQAPGSVGVFTFLAANATSAPVTVAVDDLRAAPVP